MKQLLFRLGALFFDIEGANENFRHLEVRGAEFGIPHLNTNAARSIARVGFEDRAEVPKTFDDRIVYANSRTHVRAITDSRVLFLRQYPGFPAHGRLDADNAGGEDTGIVRFRACQVGEKEYRAVFPVQGRVE